MVMRMILLLFRLMLYHIRPYHLSSEGKSWRSRQSKNGCWWPANNQLKVNIKITPSELSDTVAKIQSWEIYVYTKTSNNPVKKITSFPLAVESWWIVKIIWSTFQGKLKNNAVNSRTVKSELLGHKMHFLEFHSSGVCCWNNNAKTFNVVNNNLKIPTHSLMLYWPKDIIGYFR